MLRKIWVGDKRYKGNKAKCVCVLGVEHWNSTAGIKEGHRETLPYCAGEDLRATRARWEQQHRAVIQQQQPDAEAGNNAPASTANTHTERREPEQALKEIRL